MRRRAVAGTILWMSRSSGIRLVAGVVAAISLCGAPVAAAGGDDDDDRVEVRVRGTCTGASTTGLRVRAEEGWIRIDFRLDPRPRGGPWRVVVLHERRIVSRVTTRTSGGGSFELRRTVADWFGTDTLVVRATGPRGETCRASTTI